VRITEVKAFLGQNGKAFEFSRAVLVGNVGVAPASGNITGEKALVFWSGLNGKAFGFSRVVLVGNVDVAAPFVQAAESGDVTGLKVKTFAFRMGLNGKAFGFSRLVLVGDTSPFVWVAVYQVIV
jgi:hypothetical protein